MADRPIQVDDLVMMVRGHSCVLNRWGGVPYVVARINPPKCGGWKCDHCGRHSFCPDDYAATDKKNSRNGIPLCWLKRIDPQAISEPVETESEVTAYV